MREQREDKSISAEVELLMAYCRRFPLNWVVAYSNVNCERRAFRGLMDKGLFAWLPERIVERVQPKTRKKFKVRKPLFTRYVLIGIDRENGQTTEDILSCDGIEGLVRITENGAARTLKPTEVANVMERIGRDPMIKDGTVIKIGQHLALIAGPFQGFDLTVTAYEEGANRLKGDVAMLGRETSVEVDIDDLKISA